MTKVYLFLFFAFFGISCQDGNTPETDNTHPKVEVQGVTLEDVISRGKLTAIVNNSPTSYFIYKGRPMGYQYDLLHRLCRDFNIELEIKIISSIPNALDSLRLKKADILASGLTILSDRKKNVDFCTPITQTHQVLIQRKPDGHQKMSKSKLEKHVLRDVTQLANQPVHVEEGSSYYDRLISLQNEIGDSIAIVTYNGDIDMDSIMSQIDNGVIKYAVTDQYTAKFFSSYFPNIDIETPISFKQNISWAIPKNSTSFQDTVNAWIRKNIPSTFGAFTYNKYFKHNKSATSKAQSSYNINRGKISPYDAIIKHEAEKINWDWKLIAAQIAVESGFKPNKVSWAGAQGLMQIMPATAKNLEPNHPHILDPSTNIRLGVKLNGRLYDYWKEEIPDSLEAIKFSLASYNIGKGHVFDAQRLATKYGLNPLKWEHNVADMIVKLSRSNYYRDNVVRHGYCRGIEAYNYVNRVSNLFRNYSNFN